MKNKKYINFQNILFFALLGILVFSRFYQIEKFFYFGVDEEYQALLSWSQIKNFHITWIGVSASNIGYYLGPGLTYLGAILLWLFKGSPLGYAYFASFIGIITGLSLYFITLKLYNFKTAAFSLFLYIFSPFAFYYDRRYWPIAIPLIALWLFYSLVKSLENRRWLFLAVFLIALSYHIHITLWLFWPFIILIFIYLIITKKITLLQITFYFGLFILITSPLLVFDFVHNFDNLKLPLKILSTFGHGSGTNILFRFRDFTLIFSKIFLSMSNIYFSIFLLVLFVVISLFLFLDKKRLPITNYRLLITIPLLFFLGFIFFPSPMQEYYFVLPLPFIILTTAIILNKMKFFGYLILLAFFLVNIYGFIKQPIYSDYKNKLTIVKQASNHVKKNQFSLEIDGEYLYNGGWRYLFQANELTPTQSSADRYFGWIYPDKISSEKSRSKIIISKRNNLKYKKIITSGIYSVYISNNK